MLLFLGDFIFTIYDNLESITTLGLYSLLHFISEAIDKLASVLSIADLQPSMLSSLNVYFCLDNMEFF